MPESASSIERESHLRVLLMGRAKIGKTCTIISLVAAFGHGYVICCGDKNGMKQASARTKKFDFDVIRDEHQMEGAIKEARRGVKERQYNWVLVDDYSLYASWLELELRDASARSNKSNEPDGRRYWPEYKSRILNIPRRLFDLKTHIIFCTHYVEATQEIDGQRAKSGVGIVPMIGGSAREELPAIFQDVLFMDRKNGKRVFMVNPEGVWGPGCRSTDETREIAADWGDFFKLAQGKLPAPKVSGAR